MTWRVIARQDASLTAGARSVKAVLGVLSAGVVLAAYVYPILGDQPITTARFPGFVSGVLTTLVPLVGIVLGYNAVVSEQASGALALRLSLPHSRRDLLVGKYLARTGLLAAALVASLAVAGVLVVYPFGDLELPGFLAFVLLTVAFGAVWTGLGFAVSLAVATKQRARLLGFGLFLLFAVAWESAVAAVEFALNTAGLLEGALPEPAQFVVDLRPGRLFERLTAGFVDPSVPVAGPWYLSEWVALALFALWLVVPLGLAARRFEGRDLA